MLDKLRPALIITRREIRDQFRDWRILLPILVLTLFFPGLMNFTARQAVAFVERYGAPVIGDRLIPFLLMVVGFFPISVSLVIALESFVGEKERRSIEPLLATPLTDLQLYLGKLLAVMLPPLLASYLGIIVYLAGVYRQVGWQPDPVLLFQVVALTTVQSLLMVSGAVVISSQATSARAANLLASFIIIPMAMLLVGESMIMFWARYSVLWWAIFGQVLIAGLLVRTGIAYFNREELLGREFDMLDLSWGWRVFWNALRHNRTSLGEWLRTEPWYALRLVRGPFFLALGIFAAAAWIGAEQAQIFAMPPQALELNNLQEGVMKLQFFTPDAVSVVWLHNLRAVFLATLLGVFSFGVMGQVVLLLPFGIIGYFTVTAARAGISPWVFLTGLVLPHGIFEIPAIALAGATVLRLGATLAKPARGRSMGEALLVALADWARIFVLWLIPLFLVAAVIEVYLTPVIALRLLTP